MPNRALLILQETTAGETDRWELVDGLTTIGRAEDSTVVLADREVSRRHSQIRHEGGRYVIVDLGSKNGTLVNGVRIAGATFLADGDEILIAPRHRLIFVDSEATAPIHTRPQGLRIDPDTRTTWIAGRVLDPPLAPNQFALLGILLSAPGRVFTRDEIAAVCYPDAQGGVSDQAIDGVVRRLRARLAEVDPATEYVAAIRGHGFTLHPQ